MVPPRRRDLLRTLGATGIAPLAGCVTLATGDDEPPTEQSTDGVAQPLLYSTGGSGWLPDPDSTETGWVHTVAHGKRYDVTFAVPLARDTNQEASVSLTHAGADDYELTFSAGDQESDRENTPRDTDSVPGTHVRGGGSIPADFASLRIVAGDEPVRTIRRDGTFPKLHRLPTPIEL